MGGFGSGRYARTSGKRKCEDSLPLDIRKLNRAGVLIPGNRFGWKWSRRGRVYASIGARCEEDHLLLQYTYDKTEDVNQRIPLTWTTPNYGGTRVWFQCPYCGKRCAVLYSWGRNYACRGCAGTVHKSTGKTAIDRKLSRANRLRLKIGGIPGPAYDLPISKPKFMHRQTWNKIKNEIYDLELPFWIKSSQWLDMAESKVDKIAQRMGRVISSSQ